jgi:hypothetical protein
VHWALEPTFTTDDLFGVSFAQDGHGWIAGGAVWERDGTEWLKVPGLDDEFSNSDVDAVGLTSIWRAGATSRLFGAVFHDEGDATERVYLGEHQFTELAMAPAQDSGWTAGHEYELAATGAIGQISDDEVERVWRTRRRLWDVDGDGATVGWAAGEEGLVLRFGEPLPPLNRLFVPLATQHSYSGSAGIGLSEVGDVERP